MDVRAIARRVVRLEDRLIPQEDPEDERLAELLRKHDKMDVGGPECHRGVRR